MQHTIITFTTWWPTKIIQKPSRTKARLTAFYKIANDLVDIPAGNYLSAAGSKTRSAHSKKYRHLAALTSVYKDSFFPHTVTVWNKLPANVAESPDLVSFKQGLSALKFYFYCVKLQVAPNDSQSCAGSGHRNRIGLALRGWKRSRTQILFLFLTFNYQTFPTVYPPIFPFSNPAPHVA